MKRLLEFRLMLCLSVAALAGCASQPKFRAFNPDWQNPYHGRVREILVSLLRAAGRDPMGCSIFFLESKNLGAVSQGNCMFGVSTGLASTGDERLMRGIQANEAAHEVLGQADKRKAAHEGAVVARTIFSLGLAGATGAAGGPIIFVKFIFGLPAYSPSEQAEAEKKAAEILRTAGDPDPAGTLVYASVRLRDVGVVEPWPQLEPPHVWRHKVMMDVASLASIFT